MAIRSTLAGLLLLLACCAVQTAVRADDNKPWYYWSKDGGGGGYGKYGGRGGRGGYKWQAGKFAEGSGGSAYKYESLKPGRYSVGKGGSEYKYEGAKYAEGKGATWGGRRALEAVTAAYKEVTHAELIGVTVDKVKQKVVVEKPPTASWGPVRG